MITFFSKTNFMLSQKRVIKSWLNNIVIQENKKIGYVNIVFCNDEQLYALNKQYLNHDSFTDIITFDYSENLLLQSDIYISIERVKENAEKYNYTFDKELRRVMAHGILHLCGYKDKTSVDKLVMKQKEEEVLLLFNLPSNY
jgi:rRNA maturation RNase YbeY